MDAYLPHSSRHMLWAVLSLGLQHPKFSLASQRQLVLVQSPFKIISKFPHNLISSTLAKILASHTNFAVFWRQLRHVGIPRMNGMPSC